MFTLMDKKVFSIFRLTILPTPSPLLSLTGQVHVVERALPGRTPEYRLSHDDVPKLIGNYDIVTFSICVYT